jgi:SAM-dependent methyltransferase
MPLTPLHREALSPTISPDLPNRACILSSDDPLRLNPSFATLHVGLLENLSLPQPVDLVYSFDVLENVGDLDAFFSCCRSTLRPGGLSLHKFDLSGHEFFEDSMPPLDFKTYPRWLYRLMFPRFRRAVENFPDLFFDLMRKNGIEILEIVPRRVTAPNYLREIRPQIRKEAQLKSDGTLKLLDLIIMARKR